MSCWRPISTAPKDGTKILGLIRYASWDVGAFMGSREHFIAEIEWIDPWAIVTDFGLCFIEVEPSFWHPLPEPPEEHRAQRREAAGRGAAT